MMGKLPRPLAGLAAWLTCSDDEALAQTLSGQYEASVILVLYILVFFIYTITV